MKTLLAGFEPYGDRDINNAWEVVKLMKSSPDVDVLQIPVSFCRAHQVVIEAISQKDYNLLIMLGETSFTLDKVRMERVAINYKDSTKPDNDGKTAYDQPLIEGAPAAYFTGFPVKRVCSDLVEKDFKVKITNSTGTYVCNSLYYNILHHISQNDIPLTALFVHLPASTELISVKEMKDTIEAIIKRF